MLRRAMACLTLVAGGFCLTAAAWSQDAQPGQSRQQSGSSAQQKASPGQSQDQANPQDRGAKGQPPRPAQGPEGQDRTGRDGQRTTERSQERHGEHGSAENLSGLTDAQFVTKASQSNLGEINLGRVGTQNASHPAVRQFAMKMVQDHSTSSATLNAVANRKGFTPAPRMDEKHQQLMDKLFSVRGPEFDREYMNHMVKGHQKAVALYQHQAQNGKDEELKNFAAKTLPTVQQHLQMAQQIAQNLQGGAGSPAATGSPGTTGTPRPAATGNPGEAGAPRPAGTPQPSGTPQSGRNEDRR